MSDSTKQLEAVRKAAASADREALYRAAHSLQGCVAVVGAESMARICSKLAKVARTGSFDEINPLVAQVQSGLEVIRQTLATWKRPERKDGGTQPPFTNQVLRKRVLVIDDDDG